MKFKFDYGDYYEYWLKLWMLLKEGIWVWENKKESQAFGELNVDWDWLGLIMKVSAKKFY